MTVVIVAIVLGVALIIAGLLFGIPGTGFHGLLPRESPPTLASPGPTTSTAPTKSSQPTPEHPASYAYGFQKTWTVTPASLGLEGEQYLWLTTVTDTTWIIQVSDLRVLSSPLYYLVGVDALTGAEKWRTTPAANYPSCIGQPIDGMVYCAGAGRIFSVDPETGDMATVTNIYEAGTIQTVSGPITLDATAESIMLEELGGYLVAFNEDYRQQNEYTLISLVSPDGNILWTNPASIMASCGSAPPPDVLTGGIIVFNSLCQTGIFDVKTGELLAKPAGYVGVAGPNQLWATIAGPNTTFTSSDGVSWTIFGVRGGGDGGVQFTTSELVAPLAFTTDGKLAWINLNGSALWTADVPGNWYASYYDGTHLILSDNDGGSLALSPRDGSILWNATMPGTTTEGSPDILILADGTALTQRDDTVDAYSATTGQVYWTTTDFWVATWLRPSGLLTLAGFKFDTSVIYRIDPKTPATDTSSRPPSFLDGWTPPFRGEAGHNG